MKKQICIIPFTRNFWIEYTNLEPTPLEIFESIDILRVLKYGFNVKMVPTIHQTHAVDTVEDCGFVLRNKLDHVSTYNQIWVRP